MKRFLFALSLLTCLQSFAQQNDNATGNLNGTPVSLLTDNDTHWTISTVSTMGYVNTTPGAYYNTYKSGGGMLVKFKFLSGNRYQFMLYVQVNTYGIETETWTSLEGTTEFTKDDKGQQVLITKPQKGTYRITKNGSTTTRPIAANELQGQHSGRYLWERTTMKDDPNNTYLLLVDLKKHPNADVNKAGSIERDWVSKFHIPAGR
jgi:hypothetical protein